MGTRLAAVPYFLSGKFREIANIFGGFTCPKAGKSIPGTTRVLHDCQEPPRNLPLQSLHAIADKTSNWRISEGPRGYRKSPVFVNI
jgi:hypothetical protein